MSPCPVCGGKHLRDLTYQHRVTCHIYGADAATIHHDWQHGTGMRLARPHEQEMIHAQGYVRPDLDRGEHYGIRYQHGGGFHERSVIVVDDHGRYLRRLDRLDAEQPDDGAGGGDDAA